MRADRKATRLLIGIAGVAFTTLVLMLGSLSYGHTHLLAG